MPKTLQVFIVAFFALIAVVMTEAVVARSLTPPLITFFETVAASIIVGILFALVSARTFRRFHGNDTPTIRLFSLVMVMCVGVFSATLFTLIFPAAAVALRAVYSAFIVVIAAFFATL